MASSKKPKTNETIGYPNSTLTVFEAGKNKVLTIIDNGSWLGMHPLSENMYVVLFLFPHGCVEACHITTHIPCVVRLCVLNVAIINSLKIKKNFWYYKGFDGRWRDEEHFKASSSTEVYPNRSTVCLCVGGRGTCEVHWPNNKHLFDRGVKSIAAAYCLIFGLLPSVFFFFHPYMHLNGGTRVCPLSVCIIQSLAGNHYPEKRQCFGSMAQSVCVWVCATFVQIAYECFSGTRKGGSGDMIPMDELGPGKSQTAWWSVAKEKLALL